jgi:hypothetical protein
MSLIWFLQDSTRLSGTISREGNAYFQIKLLIVCADFDKLLVTGQF